MEDRYEYSADITLTLTNGDTERLTLRDHILARSAIGAEGDVETVIRAVVSDWGSRRLDAPVEDVEIHRVTWTGWPEGEDRPGDIVNDEPSAPGPRP